MRFPSAARQSKGSRSMLCETNASAKGPDDGAITMGEKPAARTPSSEANIDRSPPLSVAYSQRRRISGMEACCQINSRRRKPTEKALFP
jgi:hypothetical protein